MTTKEENQCIWIGKRGKCKRVSMFSAIRNGKQERYCPIHASMVARK